MFSLAHVRIKLRLVELAHDAIHPSETTIVPICFYKQAYLNGYDLNNAQTRVLESPRRASRLTR